MSQVLEGSVQRWSAWAWGCRALILLGPQVALWSTGFAGQRPAPWLAVLVLGTCLVWAVLPESVLGVVTLGLAITWWGVGLREGLSWWALVATAGLVAAHLGAVCASYGPPELAPDSALLRHWAWRALVLLSPAVAVFVVLAAIGRRPPPNGLWLLGLATTCVVTTGALVAYSLVRQAPKATVARHDVRK